MKRLGYSLLLAAGLVAAPLFAHAQGAPTRTPISIYTQPAGGEVWVDNQRVGTAPVTDWVVLPGNHKISVRHLGYQRSSENVTVKPGVGQRFTIKLVPSVMKSTTPAKTTKKAPAKKAPAQDMNQ
jgi:hypothetical protein